MLFKTFALPFLVVSVISAPSLAVPVADIELENIDVTASRLDHLDKKAARITVLTQEDIKNSTATSLPALLAQQPGITMTNLFNHGINSSIGLRGYGETATQNTLILLDGRRLNDIDLSSINFAAIPLSNIDRIEITHGSGAVLYGDGATSGTINIITHGAHELGDFAEISQRFGSFDHRETNAFFSYADSSFGLTAHLNSLKNDGYRDNNQFRQHSGQVDFRIPTKQGEAYFKLGAFEQDSEFPGVRTVDPSIQLNELNTNRSGTNTPDDWGDEYTEFATLGYQHQFNGDNQFIIDGGYRRKQQRSQFFEYAETALKTLSLTPRLILNSQLHNLPINLTVGSDLYIYKYQSNRSSNSDTIGQPFHRLNVDQRSVAFYGLGRLELSPATHLNIGLRSQKVIQKAIDNFDASAPGAAFLSKAPDYKDSDHKTSYELGLKHQFSNTLSGYFRFDRSVRFGTVDELFEFNSSFQQVFSRLKPQVADGIEIGFGYQTDSFQLGLSAFHQSLHNEIRLDPVTFQNINLDDTQHDGIELNLDIVLSPSLRLSSNYTYLKAEFTEGDNKANDLPLIPSSTVNMALHADLPADIKSTISWRYVKATYFTNDLTNSFSKKIPSYKTLDLQLSKMFGAASLALNVHNLFNEQYYNFGVNSTANPVRFNAYPLPERQVYFTATYSFD